MQLPHKFVKFKTVMVILFCCYIQCQNKSESDNTEVTTTFPTHDYKISWNSNTEPDISHYLIYAWHGPDTTTSPFKDSSNAGRYSQYFVKKAIHRPSIHTQRDTIEYVSNGDWLQFAIAAVNNSGGVSLISVSDFIKSEVADSLLGK